MKIRKFFYNAKTSADYFANLFTYMKVQGRNQYKNTNEIVSESKNKAEILLSVHKKFEKKSMLKAICKMAVI